MDALSDQVPSMNPMITPSVGSIVKKVLAINPELNVHQTIEIIRKSVKTQTQSSLAEDFASVETVNEARALELARETLRK
jgi:hypothetical protein